MDRTAEEFVHELPNGRWFVGDFLGANARGQDVFLVEAAFGRHGVALPVAAIAASSSGVRTYSRKSSAKRAAQRLIERYLDGDGGDPW